MPVQVICKFQIDLITTKQPLRSLQGQNGVFWHSRASNSEVKSLIRLEYNLSKILCLSWLLASLTKI